MTAWVKVSFYIQLSHKAFTVVLVDLHVAFSNDWMLEPIRPLPKKIPPGKKFSLCKNADGSCPHGNNCIYAHTKAEKDFWNAQLAESEDDSKSEGEFYIWIITSIDIGPFLLRYQHAHFCFRLIRPTSFPFQTPSQSTATGPTITSSRGERLSRLSESKSIAFRLHVSTRSWSIKS